MNRSLVEILETSGDASASRVESSMSKGFPIIGVAGCEMYAHVKWILLGTLILES